MKEGSGHPDSHLSSDMHQRLDLSFLIFNWSLNVSVWFTEKLTVSPNRNEKVLDKSLI